MQQVRGEFRLISAHCVCVCVCVHANVMCICIVHTYMNDVHVWWERTFDGDKYARQMLPHQTRACARGWNICLLAWISVTMTDVWQWQTCDHDRHVTMTDMWPWQTCDHGRHVTSGSESYAISNKRTPTDVKYSAYKGTHLAKTRNTSERIAHTIAHHHKTYLLLIFIVNEYRRPVFSQRI